MIPVINMRLPLQSRLDLSDQLTEAQRQAGELREQYNAAHERLQAAVQAVPMDHAQVAAINAELADIASKLRNIGP